MNSEEKEKKNVSMLVVLSGRPSLRGDDKKLK